jgi:uncharacterized protein YndB with AHSA1/START domain
MNRRPGGLLRLRSVLDAPPAGVFRMMTEPTELVKWWGPRGFTTPEVDIDLQVGGAYRLSMQPPDGDLFHLSGEFQEIDPPGPWSTRSDGMSPPPTICQQSSRSCS